MTTPFARNLVRAVCAGGIVVAGAVAWAAPAQGPGFAALARIEKGQWILRETAASRPRRICLDDPTSLFQLRHSGAVCSRFVIENTPDAATVHYTCAGTGHGRTTVTVETPRLLRIDTQGIFNGAPFAVTLEGRYAGTCRAG